MTKRLKLLFLPILLLTAAAAVIAAQDAAWLRIASVDTSNFPLIHIDLITADAISDVVPDLSALSLRENGIPVADLSLSEVTTGINVIFVIDANSSFQEVDEDSVLSRQEKTRDSISRFAAQFMSEQDKVSIIVPDLVSGSGRFLLEDAVSPDEVSAAISAYDPDFLGRTPLNEMMLLALAHAADTRGDGRYQAVLLYTDGAQVSQQINSETLATQAAARSLPVYAAILGARADDIEVANVSGLSQPTFATYVHMPQAVDSDPIFAIWQRQRTQVRISYRSLQTNSGRFPIEINLGGARATAEYSLAVVPSQIVISSGDTLIQRVGSAIDTPLSQLEPAAYLAQLSVSWPDNLPRNLVSINLIINGRAQPLSASLETDAASRLVMEWDISGFDQGTYEVVVQVIDELGLSAFSKPVTLTIEVERPLPPTPTAVPTAAPPVVRLPVEPEDWRQRLVLPLLAAGVAAVLLLVRRRRVRKETQAHPDHHAVEPLPELDEALSPSARVADVPVAAYLEMLQTSPGQMSRIRIIGDSVTVGRDHRNAQIIFDDPSVALLHARIKRRGSTYWLYDEGSAEGTFLNYDRIGLTPKMLEDQNTIHFGSIGLRFHLQQLDDEQE